MENMTYIDSCVLDKKPNKKKWFKILITIAIIVAIILLIIFKINNSGNSNAFFGILPNLDGSATAGIVPGMTDEEIQNLLQQEADNTMFGFQINATPVFENGQSSGNILIGNPPSNTFGIQVELVLDSTGDILYKSGLIEPNKHISNIYLSKNLGKGIHNATATIYVYQMDAPKLLGQSAARIKINIKN